MIYAIIILSCLLFTAYMCRRVYIKGIKEGYAEGLNDGGNIIYEKAKHAFEAAIKGAEYKNTSSRAIRGKFYAYFVK